MHQASLSFTNSLSLFKLMSIESFPFPSQQVLQGPLAYNVPEAGLGQPAKIQGSVPWTSSGP